ncbi:MAG: GumC family protein, partial [Dongiaceae bacterium]
MRSDQIVSYRPVTTYAQPIGAYAPAGGYSTAGSEEFDFGAIGRLLWRRKILIAVTTLAITMLAAVATFFMTPQYSATAYVMVEPGQVRVVEAIEAVVAGSSADTAAVESQIRVLQSRSLADRVMSVLQLDRDPEFNGKLEPPSLMDQVMAPVKQTIGDVVSTAKQWIAGPSEPPKGRDPVRALRAQIIDKILSGLVVRVEGRSRVISVTFQSRSAETAAKVANTLAEQYIAMQLEGKFEATQNAGQWLNGRVDDLRQRVQMAEAAVEKYRADNGLISAGNVSITTEEASGVGSQLALARSKRADAEARLRELDGAIADGAGAATISEVLASGLIQGLRQQEAEISGRVSDLSQKLGRSHPDLLSARAELGEIRAKIEAETQKIVHKLKNEVTAAVAREAALSESLETLKGRVGQQN